MDPESDPLDTLVAALDEHQRQGRYQEGLDTIARVRAAGQLPSDPTSLATVLGYEGGFKTWLGDLAGAVDLLAQAREYVGGAVTAQSCELAVAHAFALIALGLGEEALEVLNVARDCAHQLDDARLLYWVTNRTGVAYDTLGDFGYAREILKTAREMVDVEDHVALASIATNVVHNAISLVPHLRSEGNAADAELVLAESLEDALLMVADAASSGHEYDLSLSLGNLGALQVLAGDSERALATLQRAHDIACTQSLRPLQMSALQHMPAALMQLGRPDEAQAMLETVVSEARELGEAPVEMDALRQLADVCEVRGQFAEALAYFKGFHRVEQRLRDERAVARAHRMAHMNQIEQAKRHASRMEQVNERLIDDRRALLTQAAELERRALTDALTGVGNRRLMDTSLAPLSDAVRRSGGQLWIALIDIDRFKVVNDEHGHVIGDQTLKRVADILRRGCRPSDLIARYGGEEFLLAMSDIDAGTAAEVCNRLRHQLEVNDWSSIAEGLSVTVSIGLSAVRAGDDASCVRTIKRADRQLYAAKSAGRNRVHVDPVDHAGDSTA